MHLVIINASPRVETKSNTARIIRPFIRGFEEGGNTTEVWHLSDKKQWTGAKEAYERKKDILFAAFRYLKISGFLFLSCIRIIFRSYSEANRSSNIVEKMKKCSKNEYF